MTDSFESKLRRALKPVDPGEDFTQSVMARLGESPSSTGVKPQRFNRRWGWLTAAMAASIATIVVVGMQVREERERAAGLRAREQLLEALKVTSEKLNIAYRVVHDQTHESAGEKSRSDERKIEKSDRTGA